MVNESIGDTNIQIPLTFGEKDTVAKDATNIASHIGGFRVRVGLGDKDVIEGSGVSRKDAKRLSNSFNLSEPIRTSILSDILPRGRRDIPQRVRILSS